MEGTLRDLERSPRELTDEAVRAVQALEALGHRPILLGYHPTSRMNPYHALLYQRSWQTGVAALPLLQEGLIDWLAQLSGLGLQTVLHLHWLSKVLADATSSRGARKSRDAFLRRIDRYLGAGGRLVWTVHNVLPHGDRLEAEEAKLRTAIVERADVVHILTAATPQLVAPWFQIPDHKILHVPHPSYAGAYADFITREEARHRLGIMPDEVVHVVVGTIKPYKGLTELLDAWATMAGDAVPRRLVIAGAPSDEPGIVEALERCAVDPSVLLHAGPIPSDEIQIFLRAADIAVLPYLRSLNSGVLLLALTFGLPVVVPAGGGLADQVDDTFSRTFDPDDPSSLLATLRAADGLVNPIARAAAAAVAADRAPGPLSERFLTGMRAMLAGATDGQGSDQPRGGRATG